MPPYTIMIDAQKTVGIAESLIASSEFQAAELGLGLLPSSLSGALNVLM